MAAVVTDAVIGWFFDVLNLVLSALPTVPVPDWLDASGFMGTVFQHVGGLGVWFPIPLLVTVLGALVAVWVVAFGIKVVRIIASFFTLGGGSAA